MGPGLQHEAGGRNEEFLNLKELQLLCSLRVKVPVVCLHYYI